MEQTIITARQMQLADTVKPLNSSMSFATSTVKQITEKEVTLFRPYAHTGDFSYTGGVICYIGIEEYKIWADSKDEYVLLERKVLR